MSIRANRLVYVLIAAALGAALLISAFALPKASLTASQACYGRCPTKTVLSLSKSTVKYGHEQAEKFGVKVSSRTAGTGVPAGLVAVKSGSTTLCTIHLRRGRGICSPAAKALARGKHTIVAYYGGNSNFKPSTSNTKTLTVR